MNLWKIPLFALALGAVMSVSAAHAEDKTPPAAMAAHPAAHMFLDEKQLDKLEKMNPKQREEFFKKRHEKFKSMKPAEIQDYRDKRKAWFQSLPPEKREALKARFKAVREERLKNMSPAERKEFEERRAKWQEHPHKDGDIDHEAHKVDESAP